MNHLRSTNKLLILGLALTSLLSLANCKKSTAVSVKKGPEASTGSALPSCDAQATPPSSTGGDMKHVGRTDGSCFWMDGTEVSRGAYQTFIDDIAKVAAPEDQANVELCRGKNTDFTPTGTEMSATTLPVVGVDWCDAAAFCKWAGKRLCSSYEANNQTVSELVSVCTDGEHDGFDYNAMTDSSVCQGDGASEPVAVGSMSNCVTPTGVKDLVGNVAEWTDECKGDSFDKSCATVGGAYNSTGTQWGCKAKRSFERQFTAPYIGFRCCADEAN